MTSEDSNHTFKILSSEDKISIFSRSLSRFFGVGTLFWITISILFILLESIKLHAPTRLNSLTWSHFGEIHQISQLTLMGSLILGFLWIAFQKIVSQEQYPKRLQDAFSIFFIFLNLSLIIGVIEIISETNSNNLSGHLLQIAYFTPHSLFLLTFGLLLATPSLWLSLWNSPVLTPSRLFIALPLWTLPLILTTLLTLNFQDLLHGAYGAWLLAWSSHHLISLLLLPIALATLIDLSEQMNGEKIENHSRLRFAFWIYACSSFLTSSTLTDSPLYFLPVWLRSLDTVGSLFTIFALFIVLQTLFEHLRPHFQSLKKIRAFGFFIFAALSLLFLILFKSFFAFRTIESRIQFTTISMGLQNLLFFGFLMTTLFLWIYHQIPRLFERQWVSESLIQTHFWLTSISTGLTTLGLLIAGIIQSSLYVPFTLLQILHWIRPFFWLQSLALVFQFSGVIILSLLFILLLFNKKTNPRKSIFMEK